MQGHSGKNISRRM